MSKAGGVISIISGIFGFFAAILTLLVGGAGAAFEAQDSDLVIGLGWGGIVFSFACIVLGAMGMSAESKSIGILLIGSSVAGIIFGGSFVAVCLVLAVIGGVLVTIGAKSS